MAGIFGHATGQWVYGDQNPYISTELDDYDEVSSKYDVYQLYYQYTITAIYSWYRIAADNSWGIIGNTLPTFFNDFYNRIHISPQRIDLGTVASSISREITVWNAYTHQSATLDQILIQNGTGIAILGDTPPLTFFPLQEKTWEVTITPEGPPEINASILFDFLTVQDPLPVVIVGNRSVILPAIPEVPVIEKWKWLTDVQIADIGEEQRIGLLNAPRRRLSTRLVFESDAELREQYKILLAARGRLFIPYFQYASVTTAATLAGGNVLMFDTGHVDLRDGDYVMLIDDLNVSLIQLETISANSATTQAPLSADVPKGTKIISTFASILPNDLSLSRAAVNNYGTMQLQSDARYPRPLQRPGGTATLLMLDGYPILNRRPLADEEIDHSFDTGQGRLDAKTGLFDVDTDWDFTKVDSEFNFKARRLGRNLCNHTTGVQEMDYWRLFFDEMKGSLKNFLLSSYRPDQLPASAVGVGADSMIFIGGSYVDTFWPALAYHYISINTAAGSHFAKVTAASKNAEGNTTIGFTPALPASASWANVKDVSYLLKLRIEGDEVALEHYALDTIFSFKTRTVKE
jgi:hypothetical protein